MNPLNPTTDFVADGTLIAHAQARSTVIDGEGHVLPVLCMDVEMDGELHTHLHVEQMFPRGQHEQCALAAKRLKSGTRVQVQAPVTAIRISVRYAQHIHMLGDSTPSFTAQQPVVADNLF